MCPLGHFVTAMPLRFASRAARSCDATTSALLLFALRICALPLCALLLFALLLFALPLFALLLFALLLFALLIGLFRTINIKTLFL
jgi:hypothetical protein